VGCVYRWKRINCSKLNRSHRCRLPYAGRDYSHRKQWVLERLSQLSSIFAIDICAYAVMSNHYRLVMFVDQLRAQKLTHHEIVASWLRCTVSR
jgi:uncharacterized cysteine cluster protein YcgN (CxxCxxCC family)